ncbi:hypothetical protein ACFVSW_21530 [Neobacillus sp. NPDC058068]|uniref:hypothetical protein n=1 Tax=Neobacillus sp. NPDC058068 TaxID=3346325 RepID=UPI0036DC5A95
MEWRIKKKHDKVDQLPLFSLTTGNYLDGARHPVFFVGVGDYSQIHEGFTLSDFIAEIECSVAVFYSKEKRV